MKIEGRQSIGNHLAMTPQLSQSIRMLQWSTLEFEQELELVLADNPFVEREDPVEVRLTASPTPESFNLQGESQISATDQFGEPEPDNENLEQGMQRVESASLELLSSSRNDDDSASTVDLTPAEVGLRDHLLEQVRTCRTTARELMLARVIIHALEPDGYLRIELGELAEICPTEYCVRVDELEAALQLVQSLEPIGIAARSLAECLTLQLAVDNFESRCLSLARQIVAHHLEELAVPDTARLLRTLSCTESELASAYQKIRACSPKPGLPFAEGQSEYVVADVLVRKENRRWVARIKPAITPNIHLNHDYAAAYAGRRNAGSSQAAQKLQEARWFLRDLQQAHDEPAWSD